jgi:hypothetical protein
MKRVIKKVKKYFKVEKVCQHQFDINEVLDMNCDPKCLNCHEYLDNLTEEKLNIKL